VVDVHATMSSDAFQDRDQQRLLQVFMERNRNPLKTGRQSLKPNMSTDLLDKMVIPTPAQAIDQIVPGQLRGRSQAAKKNCDMTSAKRTSNLSQSSS
jgi:hypothetical protein